MLHRHPLLSLVTLVYLAFVGWITLTPGHDAPTSSAFVQRVLDKLQSYDRLAWLTDTRAEFLANVALFAPVGLFLLLLVGTRYWWVAAAVAFAMTNAIELAQRAIPGRVADERDIAANTLGAMVGIAVGVVLTLPATLRRERRTRLQSASASRLR
jgi:glycopeptide antibiotics resistance protein